MARAEVLAVAPSLVAAWAEVASAEASVVALAEASEEVAVAAVAQAEDFREFKIQNSEFKIVQPEVITRYKARKQQTQK